MGDIECAFRQDVRKDSSGETATCDFVQRLTGADKRFCSVDKTACEVCIQGAPLSPSSINPVMPSLLLRVCTLAFPDSDRESPEGLLRSWALHTVENDGRDVLVAATHACDAVLVCQDGDSTEAIALAAESILDQDGAQVCLHIVSDGHDRESFPDGVIDRPNVFFHWFEFEEGFWRRFAALFYDLEMPYVAFIDVNASNAPNRIHRSIDRLENSGGEVFAAAQEGGNQVSFSRCDVDSNTGDPVEAEIQPRTLVIRRSTLADLCAGDRWRFNNLSEMVCEAVRQKRAFEFSSDVLVQAEHRKASVWSSIRYRPTGVGATDSGPRRLAYVKQRFSKTPVRCDVVLPFRDGFEYVHESMEALLQQRDADLVIHLVDDASQESSAGLFERYRDHQNVRLYRNDRNLGPFATFNNISEIAETGIIAVQDADDVSLPDRIANCCQLLNAAGADIVAGATELFGDARLVSEICMESITRQDGRSVAVRRSRYPSRTTCGYYLENPTLVMRTQHFIRLGGYGDFGEGKRNRTGVDTDFQLRAFFARAKIAITQDIVMRYRCHGGSATNSEDTGMGSVANVESQEEVSRRFRRYAQGTFDPQWFGAIGKFREFTRRVS